MERKLAAIMVADVVGYSAQMERDEAGTYDRVTGLRKDRVEPEVARHHGRIFKLTGDGFLAEFGSAVDAVECAISLQEALAARNAAVPGDQAIWLRIGINLGEVIVDGDDRYGEGVNIAARLEQLAEAGGVCVSEKVAREVEAKLAFGFESMGVKKVKNIAEPIHVFRVSPDARKGPRARRRALAPWRRGALAMAAALIVAAVALGGWMWSRPPARAAGPPVLAVLPFANLSGDPAQDYLGPGVADDIITMLSTSPVIQVLSKVTTATLAGSGTSTARQLGVDYMLDGSIRKSGDTLRLSAQLVDARTGHNLWADRLDQDGTDVVAMQEAIVRKTYGTIAGLTGEVMRVEEGLTWRKSAPSLAEYDYHLRGGAEFLKFTPAGRQAAFRIWGKGLERFPDSALLRLELAAQHLELVTDEATADPESHLAMAGRLLSEVGEKPDLSRMETWLWHYVRAGYLPKAEGDLAGGVREAAAAHAMVPFDPMSSADLSRVMANAGEAGRAVEWAEYAVANEPVVPGWYRDNLAWAYYLAGRPEDAVAAWERSDFWCMPCKAAALARVGRIDEAKALVAELKARDPGWSADWALTAPGGLFPLLAERLRGPYRDDLRAAGLE